MFRKLKLDREGKVEVALRPGDYIKSDIDISKQWREQLQLLMHVVDCVEVSVTILREEPSQIMLCVGEGKRLETSSALIEEVLKTERKLCVEDVAASTQWGHACSKDLNMGAYYGFPLFSREGLLCGCLSLCYEGARAITDKDMQMIEVFVRAFERIFEFDDAFKKDLVARKVMLERYLNDISEIVVSINKEGLITLLNASGYRLLEHPEGSLLGKDWFKTCLPKDIHAEVLPVFKQLMSGGIENIRYFENPVITGSGKRIDMHWHNVILTDDCGSITGILCSGINITHRKKLERENQAAQALHQRLFAAIEQMSEAVVVTDPEGIVEYVNPAFSKNSGYSRNYILGKHTRLLKSGENTEDFYKNLWNAITAGEEWTGVFINKRKDDRVYHAKTIITPIADEGGVITGYVAIQRDVTDQVLLEANLQNIQKLQAVGTLAGGIAHDFNNILTGILGNLSFLKKYELKEDDPAHATVDNIFSASYRARDLVEQIMTFSRPHVEDMQPVSVIPIVKEVIKLLKNSTADNVDIQIVVDTDCDIVLGSASKIYQIVMNLCVNAMDAMSPDGGVLTIAMSEGDMSMRSRLQIKEEPCFLLKISDEGCGIPAEIQERIFEPFYTTKPVGKGTGLGLAVVFGVVESMQGKIFCESKEGEGTRFSVLLPLEKKHKPQAQRDKLDAFSLKDCKVLLVDDDLLVLDALKLGLKALGAQVHAFENGLEAMQYVKDSEESMDIAILDYSMDAIRGDRLCRQLHAWDDQLPIVFLTGIKDPVIISLLKSLPVRKVIDKPVSLDDVAKVVYDILRQA